MLIVDSHIKGFAAALTTVLPSKFEICSIVKPGANTKSISASIQEIVNKLTQDDMIEEIVNKLTQDDMIVLSSGTNDNDNDQDYYKSTFVDIKEYLFSLSHTKVLVLGIPFRYDLQNSREVNSIITKINTKISKLVQLLPNARFLPSNNDGKLFTKHGLHRNKFGKHLLVTQLARNIFNTLSPIKPIGMKGIPLPWNRSIENPQETNTVKTVKQNSNRPRKTPLTRSADFLW